MSNVPVRNIVNHDHYIEPMHFEDFVSYVFGEESFQEAEREIYSCANITFQVTEACNLCCTYCYQHHKSKKKMSLECAKKAIDIFMADEKYIAHRKKRAAILDFIGGEPLLEIELIEKIYDYFIQKCIDLNSHWIDCHRISLCTNGVLYRDPKVKKFIEKHKNVLSLTVSVDGPKEVHDACRVFYNGEGSFSYAIDAMADMCNTFNLKNTKATIAPENVSHLSQIVKFFYEGYGFSSIMLNCTYEGPWTTQYAKILYDELIKISDYCYEHDTYSSLSLSIFSEIDFVPIDYNSSGNNKNWCGGCGDMVAVNPDGKIYPCLRYMESSIGYDIEPVIIGNISHGIGVTEREKYWINQLNEVTATSQSSEECIKCPVAKGCGWCSAYNYEKLGSFNKRVTEICLAHKARALANVYYWNKFYEKHNIPNVYENFLPHDEAVKIIGNENVEVLTRLIKLNREKLING